MLWWYFGRWSQPFWSVRSLSDFLCRCCDLLFALLGAFLLFNRLQPHTVLTFLLFEEASGHVSERA